VHRKPGDLPVREPHKQEPPAHGQFWKIERVYIVVDSNAQETAKQGAIQAGVIMSNKEPDIAAGRPNGRLKAGAKHCQIVTPNGSLPEKPGPVFVENPLRLIPRQSRPHPLPSIEGMRAADDDWLCHLPPVFAPLNLLPDGASASSSRVYAEKNSDCIVEDATLIFTPMECLTLSTRDLYERNRGENIR
jgi:hypothetical protein